MLEVRRRVIASTPLQTGRLVRLECTHKQLAETMATTDDLREMIVCDECTAAERAIKAHLRRCEEISVVKSGASSGRFWS